MDVAFSNCRRPILTDRFGAQDDDELKRLAALARAAIEEHVVSALGFPPKYQLRWVGVI